MTRTTDLIAELIRAANEVARRDSVEMQDLLSRGLATAAALRDLVNKTGKVIPISVARDPAVADVTANPDKSSNEAIAQALLRLADQIRRLRIVNRS